jgi:pilus assembly protein Flp/PilA
MVTFSNGAIAAANAGSFQMSNLISQFLRDDSGATAIEYGLIAALIAVVIIAAVELVGTNLQTTFSTVAAKI